MSEKERAFELACEILASRQERFAWKTAKYLSKQLRERGCPIGKKELEDLLIVHSRSRGRVVRYSSFPAKKSLDLLWGHVLLVGELKTLPNITLDTEHEYYDPCDVSEDAPWCFLSHSYRDLKTVLDIRDKLLAWGYGVWIFEAEISEQARIHDEVQEGLNRSQIFVVYVSRQSLGSRWVLKEMLVAFNTEHLKPYVVINGSDQELISFFHKWLASGWANVDLREETERLLCGIDEPDETVATTEIPALLEGMTNCPVENRHLVIYHNDPSAEELEPQWDPKPLSFDRAFS